jgi:5-methylthioadenosine/S-adenosylhomocysteine deaminase
VSEEVDILIRNADVLTLNDTNPVLRNYDIAITHGRIVRVDKQIKLDSKRELEGKGKIVMPGLVDAHTHTFQILLRGAMSSAELNAHPVWLKILIPFEAEMSEEEATISAELACLNMIRKGITAFADAGGPYPELLAATTEKAGLRGRITHSTMDMGPKNYRRNVDDNKNLVSKLSGDLVKGWYSIRQIMVSSDKLIEETIERAEQDNVGIHIHLSEEVAEIDHALSRWGQRPFEYLHSRKFLSRRILAAHCAFLSDHETRLIAQDSVNVVHCPMINMAYMTFPKVPRLLELGANVALGSDGGSYRGLDLFTEMNIAMTSHTGNFGTPYYDFDILSAPTLLRMASTNGYKAIMQDDAGMIKEGYRADLIAINRRQAHLMPMHDLTAIPLFATGNDVVDMIVDGKLIMSDGRVITLDEQSILTNAQRVEPSASERIRRYVQH